MKIICDKNSVYRFLFCSLLAQLVKYDVHTTRKIKIDARYFITYYHFIRHPLLIRIQEFWKDCLKLQYGALFHKLVYIGGQMQTTD